MAVLELNGEVVADFPVLYLGQLEQVADRIERINATFVGTSDNLVAGIRTARPILELVNALLPEDERIDVDAQIDTMTRADAVTVSGFYFALLTESGLKSAPGEGEAGATADQALADQPSPRRKSRSASSSAA